MNSSGRVAQRGGKKERRGRDAFYLSFSCQRTDDGRGGKGREKGKGKGREEGEGKREREERGGKQGEGSEKKPKGARLFKSFLLCFIFLYNYVPYAILPCHVGFAVYDQKLENA